MAGNKDGQGLQVMNGGKLNKYHRRKNCEDVSPPQPVKQASVLKMPSGVDQSDKGIDLFKVNTAILPGVQNYWGERAAEHEMQMATRLNNLLTCQNTLVVR